MNLRDLTDEELLKHTASAYANWMETGNIALSMNDVLERCPNMTDEEFKDVGVKRPTPIHTERLVIIKRLRRLSSV